MEFDYAPGATPLDPDEAAGLLPTHITTQRELNEWEQANILEGGEWARRQSRREILDDVFVRELHRRLFNHTWKWAGQYRSTDKNIGVAWPQVSTQVRNLLADAQTWVAQAVYPADEIAVRLHHRLVWIHPFANGNGRHARLMSDLLLQRLGRPAFSWGGKSLAAPGDVRRAYLDALRAADGRDYGPLLKFARGE